MEQGTPEWKAARAGRLTASLAAKAISFLKNGSESAGRRDLRYRIVAERLSGRPIEDDYVSGWMQRGTDLQPDALAAYELKTDIWVDPVGFIMHDTLAVGCSPDGLVDDGVGGVELKVPKTATHVEYLRTGGVPSEYVPQLLHSMWICDADWWDFVSYSPDLPEALQLFVVRMHRDDAVINEFEAKVMKFLRECETETEALRTMANAVRQFQAAAAVTAPH
jgi:hypothetical protein